MARKETQPIYCWQTKSKELNIYLASTENGASRVGIKLGKRQDCLDYFKSRFSSGRLVKNRDRNRGLHRAVMAALDNVPDGMKVPLDIECTAFHREALQAIQRIPFGETRTYGEVAKMIGRPGGARAVGQAMGKNPLPLIFP